ncbi:ArsA family ATPase [Yinghuangia soli]|uniref:ArsA family ATPase n=1 Tax=Yinghuangia soli TaxID=2908204 RepID=A0AA41U4W4_9ACTN|nr:ArsA-related P-loop ATPase [Yinghuangia soli]MCF2531242.1 ArsA family ATPase [Yinghuangia soli]
MTRVLLVTGTGGAGRTTVAAATAAAAARAGTRTLLLAADGTADAETVLGVALGSEPVEVEPRFFAARVAVREEFEREFLLVQDQLRGVLALIGVDPLDPEEITAVPGAADALALRVLARHAGAAEDPSGPAPRPLWDLIVVDLPPVDRTALALALPESLARYLDRLLPVERQAARALRPVLAAVAGVPMPDEWLYETARRVIGELDAVRAVLDAPGTSVRLVTRSGAVAAATDRRAAAALALYGRRVDDVIVNAVPHGATLPRERGTSLRALFPGAGVAAVGAADDEPLGSDALAEFAESLPPVPGVALPGEASDALGGTESYGPFGVEADGERLVLVVPLPGAERGDLDLLRRGDELVVTVGAHRRLIPLPSALRRCTIEGAGLRGGMLRVRFVPDPAVWMRT